MRRLVRLLLLLTVGLLAGLFASVNTQPVTIHYLLGSGELRLAWLLLLVVGIGIVLGWLAGLPLRWRRSREVRRLRIQQQRLESELQATRPLMQTPPGP